MRKILVVLLAVCALTAQVLAIDGAMGLGQGRSKVELGYTGGAIGLAYDMGFNDDLTVYGSVYGSGTVGFGAGVKYAFLNERKGNDFSFAGKLDLLLGGGTVFPVPGLVVSKKSGDMTLLADFSTYSIGGFASFTWFGVGGLWDFNNNMQFAGLLGTATVMAGGYRASGLGFGIGLNWLL